MKDPRYLIVAGACLVQFTIIGFLFAFSLFFKQLETELGWSRTLLSAGASLATFMMGALAIFGGRLNDRFGPRIVLSITGVMFAVGMFLLSLITQPWQYILLFGTLLAVGFATHDVVTLSTVARWFDKRRGIMTGVVKTGTAAGQMLMPPLAAAIIVWMGWRTGLVALSVLSGVLLLLAASLMRLPGPGEGPSGTGHQHAGQTFEQARKTRIFWTLCVIQFLFFPTMMTIPLHIAIHGMDLGMTPERAALLLSVMGASSVVGRLALGGLLDRIGGRNSYLIALGVLMISLSLFPSTVAHGPLTVLVGLYGFAHGSLFVVVSPTVARYFGMRAHGSIFGMVLFFGTVGGAIGPTLTGWVFDTWGSYVPAFITLGVAALIAFLLTLSLPKEGQKPTSV